MNSFENPFSIYFELLKKKVEFFGKSNIPEKNKVILIENL